MTRILYAPRNISGQASEYLKAVAPHGYSGEVWSYGPTAFGFPADRIIDVERWKVDTQYRWVTFREAVDSFDIFHLQFSASLLPSQRNNLPRLWDLPLLKYLGKKVFMHFRGSDVRLPHIHMQREADSFFHYTDYRPNEDRVAATLAVCRRYCDALFVSTPGLLDYVPDATWIPHTIDAQAWAPQQIQERTVPIVVHAPSSRGFKHSDKIDAIIEHLHTRGLCVYQALEGLSHHELMHALLNADVLIDSLGIGDHGLISVEAMAAGTVPVAHIHTRNRSRNPGVPVVEATADTLHDVLIELCTDKSWRVAKAHECITWARSQHDHASVGRLLASFYSQAAKPPSGNHPEWPAGKNQLAKAESQAPSTSCKVTRPAARRPSVRTTIRRAGAATYRAARIRRIARLFGSGHEDV